jgi:SAM-dependent methyltransferase
MPAVKSASVLPVAQTVCWGTHEEAARLGVQGEGTRKWAYRWIEEHIRHIAPVTVIVDIGGGGVDSVLPRVLSQFAAQVLVVDRVSDGRSDSNVRAVAMNLEEGLSTIADNSIDVVVSASSIEHLTAAGQRKTFAEIQRVLKPAGVFCGTVSYVTRLTDEVIGLIERDPIFEQTGSSVHARFDARACLEAAPALRPPFAPLAWSHFPGFAGFDEEMLLGSETLISQFVGSYDTVRVLPEIDALKLSWYEMGLFLRKDVA